MIEIDSTPVRLQGEALNEIWWRGKQWAVTSRGIEALNGTYFIESERLLNQIAEWPWPRQIGEKTWADADEFATAFMVALVLHGYSQVEAAGLRKHLDKMVSERLSEDIPRHGAADA